MLRLPLYKTNLEQRDVGTSGLMKMVAIVAFVLILSPS